MMKKLFSFLIVLLSSCIFVRASIAGDVSYEIKYCKEWADEKKIAVSVHHPQDDKIQKFSWKLEGTGRIIDTAGNGVGEVSTLQNEIFLQLPEEVDTSDTVTVFTILSFVDDGPQVLKEGPISFSEILSEIKQAPMCSPYLSMQEKTGEATGQGAAVDTIREDNPAKGAPGRMAKKNQTGKNSIPIQDKFKLKSGQKKIIVLQPTKYKLAVKPDLPVIDPVESEETTEQNIYENTAQRPVDATVKEQVLQVKPVESKPSEVAGVVAPEPVIIQDEVEKIHIPASDKLNLEPSRKKVVVLNATKHKLVKEPHLPAGEAVEKEEKVDLYTTNRVSAKLPVGSAPEEELLEVKPSEVVAVPVSVPKGIQTAVEKSIIPTPDRLNLEPEQEEILVIKATEQALVKESRLSAGETVGNEEKVELNIHRISAKLPVGTAPEDAVLEVTPSEVVAVPVPVSVPEVTKNAVEKSIMPLSDRLNLEPEQEKTEVLKASDSKPVEESRFPAVELVEKEEELVEQSTVAGSVEQAVESVPEEEVLVDESPELAVQPATVRVVREYDAEKRTQETEKTTFDAQEDPVVQSKPADEEATEDVVESVAEPVEKEVKVVQSSTIEPDNLPLGTDQEKEIKDDAQPVRDIQADQDVKTPPTRLSKEKPADVTKENLGKSLW